jgi:hypothetical protein
MLVNFSKKGVIFLFNKRKKMTIFANSKISIGICKGDY